MPNLGDICFAQSKIQKVSNPLVYSAMTPPYFFHWTSIVNDCGVFSQKNCMNKTKQQTLVCSQVIQRSYSLLSLIAIAEVEANNWRIWQKLGHFIFLFLEANMKIHTMNKLITFKLRLIVISVCLLIHLKNNFNSRNKLHK